MISLRSLPFDSFGRSAPTRVLLQPTCSHLLGSWLLARSSLPRAGASSSSPSPSPSLAPRFHHQRASPPSPPLPLPGPVPIPYPPPPPPRAPRAAPAPGSRSRSPRCSGGTSTHSQLSPPPLHSLPWLPPKSPTPNPPYRSRLRSRRASAAYPSPPPPCAPLFALTRFYLISSLGYCWGYFTLSLCLLLSGFLRPGSLFSCRPVVVRLFASPFLDLCVFCFSPSVALSLLLRCECKNDTENTLLRAGYGGWLLYTAASAGDMGFVQELLDRDPLLVFGEDEYGVTGMFYVVARGGDAEVFRMLLDHAMSPRCSTNCRDGEGANGSDGGRTSVFRLEMMSRAVHAAARGGSVEMLRELVQGRSDVSAYIDVRGSNVLHAAAGRGQLERKLWVLLQRCAVCVLSMEYVLGQD